jgi:hypothetical protein
MRITCRRDEPAEDESKMLQKYRLRQPIEELRRKANKAARKRSKLWTQEEIDLARAEAIAISVLLGWGDT